MKNNTEILEIKGQRSGRTCRVRLHAASEEGEKPLLLILPGGGYEHLSTREAGPVAEALMPAGLRAAVMDYSLAPERFPQAMVETASVIQYFRKNGKRHGIDPRRIHLLGFSAGGHLALSYTVYAGQREFWQTYLFDPETSQPDSLLLAYPVVTSGPYAHRGSFENLLGPEGEQKGVSAEVLSAEKRIRELSAFPPMFLWHTFEDRSVPIENSLLLLCEVRRCFPDLPLECHFYEKGRHGLALADRRTDYGDGSAVEPRAARWVDAAADWLRERNNP